MYSRMTPRSINSRRPSSLEGRLGGRGVYVPPNYSGTAIGTEEQPTPHFDDLPRVSTLPQPSDESPSVDRSPPYSPETSDITPSPVADVPHLGGLLGGDRFPFGHGMGYEELFLLGLLLFLSKEAESGEDNDLHLTLLLLGALLFCG